jgi:hypothetical protein
MTKYITFLIIFLLGCQDNWSISEQEDFKRKCANYYVGTTGLDNYKDFCDCILMESMNLSLPYSQFLKMESNNFETENLLNSCIKKP